MQVVSCILITALCGLDDIFTNMWNFSAEGQDGPLGHRGNAAILANTRSHPPTVFLDYTVTGTALLRKETLASV